MLLYVICNNNKNNNSKNKNKSNSNNNINNNNNNMFSTPVFGKTYMYIQTKVLHIIKI